MLDSIEHGGRLAHIKRQFPQIKDWLDLSTGISAWSYPCGAYPPSRDLPDEDLQTQVQAAAAHYFAIAETYVLCAAGAQALIRILPQVMARLRQYKPPHKPPHKPIVFIAECAYGEYAASAALHNCEVRFLSVERTLPVFPNGSLVILGNPNNPDGAFLSADKVSQLAEALQNKGLLVIDEAFCDYYPQKSATPFIADYDNIAVLKSFGKFFGLGGLRLGFALAQPSLLQVFADILGVWSVATPALTVAEKAYGDSAWIKTQHRRIAEHSQKLQNLLQDKTEIICNSGLFVSCLSQADLFTELAQAGIYIRGFSAYENLYRFGLPADEAAFVKLQQALSFLQP